MLHNKRDVTTTTNKRNQIKNTDDLIITSTPDDNSKSTNTDTATSLVLSNDEITPTLQLAGAMHSYFEAHSLFPADVGSYTTSILAEQLTAAKNLLGRNVVIISVDYSISFYQFSKVKFGLESIQKSMRR